MENYKNKVVWITGASSGLGEALALEFAKQGARLILSGRDSKALEAVQARVIGSRIVIFDIANTEILQDKVEEAVEAFGHIDIVVHNAGIAQNSMGATTDKSTEDKIWQINYLSPVQLTKYLLPHFIERKSGHIVAISGLLAYINLPGRTTYAATKAALNSYFGCLRGEVKASNIGVSVVIPGSLSTNLVNKALTGDGSRVANKKTVQGYSLDKAALKIVTALSKKKQQIYVGSTNEFMMWKMSGLYPNFIIKQILGKVK